MGHGGPFSVISTKIHIITRGLPRVLVGRWLLRSTPGDTRAGFALETRISAFFGVAGLRLEPGGDSAWAKVAPGPRP